MSLLPRSPCNLTPSISCTRTRVCPLIYKPSAVPISPPVRPAVLFSLVPERPTSGFPGMWLLATFLSPPRFRWPGLDWRCYWRLRLGVDEIPLECPHGDVTPAQRTPQIHAPLRRSLVQINVPDSCLQLAGFGVTAEDIQNLRDV